jgi:hypothetical protein
MEQEIRDDIGARFRQGCWTVDGSVEPKDVRADDGRHAAADERSPVPVPCAVLLGRPVLSADP